MLSGTASTKRQYIQTILRVGHKGPRTADLTVNPELIKVRGGDHKSSVILKNNFVSIVEAIKHPNVQSHPSTHEL